MGLNEENMRLRMRLNALKEQNDRLIGTVKVLEATNEQLTLKNESLEKLYKEFKDAFDDVFIRNVSDSWARVDDETKRTMKTQDKIYFFNREVNNTKIAIRDYLLDKLKKMEKEKNDEITELQQKLEGIEREKTARESRPYENNDENNNIIENTMDNWKKNKTNEEGGSPDDKEKRDAHKRAMSTQNGNSMFSNVFTNSQSAPPKEAVFSKQEEDQGQANKIHLTYVPPVFKEISKDKAVTEGLRYVKIKEKLDELNKNEIDELVVPILEKIKKEIPYERQPVIFLLLKMIGETGWYTIKDFNEELQRRLKEETGETEKKNLEAVAGKSNIIQNQMFLLNNLGLIESINSSVSGGKGRPSKVYMLSNHGNILYTYLYKEDPVRSIYVTMAKNQKSVEHATNIKKVLDILEANGYVCTQEDRIDLPDGRSSICDILTQKNGYQFRLEIEDGNYNKQKYFEKYEKILLVDNWLIFITPTAKEKEKLKKYFVDFLEERIYNGMDEFKQAGKKHIFLSIAELQENPDVFYDNMTKEN